MCVCVCVSGFGYGYIGHGESSGYESIKTKVLSIPMVMCTLKRIRRVNESSFQCFVNPHGRRWITPGCIWVWQGRGRWGGDVGAGVKGTGAGWNECDTGMDAWRWVLGYVKEGGGIGGKSRDRKSKRTKGRIGFERD